METKTGHPEDPSSKLRLWTLKLPRLERAGQPAWPTGEKNTLRYYTDPSTSFNSSQSFNAVYCFITSLCLSLLERIPTVC